MEARNDSALAWALVLARLRGGDPADRTLAGTVRDVAEASPGSRLNFLLTDGGTITATAWGDSLCLTRPDGGTVVASQPYDDDPHWQQVPDRTLLTAHATEVRLTPLAAVPGTPQPARSVGPQRT